MRNGENKVSDVHRTVANVNKRTRKAECRGAINCFGAFVKSSFDQAEVRQSYNPICMPRTSNVLLYL